jgi:hypothetical protein
MLLLMAVCGIHYCSAVFNTAILLKHIDCLHVVLLLALCRHWQVVTGVRAVCGVGRVHQREQQQQQDEYNWTQQQQQQQAW